MLLRCRGNLWNSSAIAFGWTHRATSGRRYTSSPSSGTFFQPALGGEFLKDPQPAAVFVDELRAVRARLDLTIQVEERDIRVAGQPLVESPLHSAFVRWVEAARERRGVMEQHDRPRLHARDPKVEFLERDRILMGG